jgi:hypothetical protein
LHTRRAFPHEHLILDACCVINLLASTQLEEIVTSLQTHVAIATYVQEQELLSEEGSLQSLGNPKGIADLKSLESQGLLTYESPQEGQETVNYINYAAVFGDDGEAVTCAIASVRGWAIATDDKKPINFLRRTAPHIPIVTTLDIIKFWSEWGDSSPASVSKVLRNIRIFGRYEPSRSHHLYEWWRRYIGN